jgi:hypothetical protein
VYRGDKYGGNTDCPLAARTIEIELEVIVAA